jgi:hypothetical protein
MPRKVTRRVAASPFATGAGRWNTRRSPTISWLTMLSPLIEAYTVSVLALKSILSSPSARLVKRMRSVPLMDLLSKSGVISTS